MTDNEIINALECCTKDAIDLIQRQQEHIEDLEALTTLRNKRKYYNKFVTEVYQKEKGELHYPDFDEIYKRYFEQQEEIKRLQNRCEDCAGCTQWKCDCACVRQEFADKIIERLEAEKSDWNYDYNVPINKAIGIVKGVTDDR